VAYVVLKDGGADGLTSSPAGNGRIGDRPSNEDLQYHLRRSLPDYMIPAVFVFLDRLPLTPNGKVDRRSLPAPGFERPMPEEGFVGPRNEAEEQLCRIWQSILGIPQVGVKDDFFSLGGDSLSVIQMAVKAEEVFGRHLSIVTVVQARTVERLAMHLSAPCVLEAAGSSHAAPSSVPSAVVVRQMTEADLDEVIDIHIERFPEWRVTMLGRPFLRAMYRWFIEREGELTLVAVAEGKPIGFTVGSVGGYKRHLFFKALPEIALGVARNPLQVWKATVRRLLRLVGGKFGIESWSSSLIRDDVADNNIMAVSRSASSGGIELMVAFEEAARRRAVKPHFHEQN
jgi:acyl carrier protein